MGGYFPMARAIFGFYAHDFVRMTGRSGTKFNGLSEAPEVV
jgi:hypothetical protein